MPRSYTHDEIEKAVTRLEHTGFKDIADMMRYLMEQLRNREKQYR